MSPEDQATLEAEAKAIEGEHIPAAEAADALPPELDYDKKTADGISALTFLSFNLAAPAWGVKPEECEDTGIEAARVIKQYWPDVKIGPVFGLFIAVGAIAAPRIIAGVPMRAPTPPPTEDTTPDAPAG